MQTKQKPRFDMILIGIACLAAFLNIYNIWNNLTGNTYYTAAVTSMLQSWHNFFFNSFDPGGYITIDKPPVTFWVQSLFAYIFGVHGWSVILPQALAGVGSVFLMYKLIKPSFGLAAARWASLIIACTPVAVAVSRTNNIDSLLVFTLLVATWMLFKAIRNQKLSWVLGAFAMIGVGFNEKMLQAYMVVPAFYLFYLLAFKCEWKKKLAILTAATVVLVSVSLSWAVIVDSIPQANRPYIGGSKTNSVLELALGYNGISRLTGNRGGGMGANHSSMSDRTQWQNDGGATPESFAPGSSVESGYRPQGTSPDGFTPNGAAPNSAPPQGFTHNGNGGPGQRPTGNFKGNQGQGGGMFNTGQAGPLRLFQSQLSGQASWLLPLVGFACIALLAGIRRRKPLTDKQKETLFWLAWLIPAAAFFSIAGFFHQYYLIMLAPPAAALAGTGWVELCHLYRSRNGWKMWLLPAALLATTAFELYILEPYQSQIGVGWLIGIGAAGTIITVSLILAGKKEKLTSIAMTAGLLVLLAGPLYWAATPLIYGDNSVMPAAGPSQMGSRQGSGFARSIGTGMKSDSADSTDKLIDYLTRNNSGEKYLFATTDANTAGPYIIKTGKAVMAMGGFSGSDPALTVSKLEKLVKNKEVKYFLISGRDGGQGGSSEVLNWIRTHSTEVPQSEWQSATSPGGQMGRGESSILYMIDQSKL